MKKWISLLLVLAILGTGGYYGYQFYRQRTALPASAEAQKAYTEYTVGRGNLAKSVTGTGTLSIARTENLSLAYAVTVTETLVDVPISDTYRM